LTNLEKYKKSIDQSYFEGCEQSMKNLREGIAEVEDLLDDPDITEDNAEALEAEVSMLQEMLVSAQSQMFFLEQSPPSKAVVDAMVEKFSPEDLDKMLELIQSPLYNEFFDTSHALEEGYALGIAEQVGEYLEGLYGNRKSN
jgi:antitoxin component HigA of HigAB toxin-antitoxin module